MNTHCVIRVVALMAFNLLATSLFALDLPNEHSVKMGPAASASIEPAIPVTSVTPWLWENINNLQKGSDNASLNQITQQGQELTIQHSGTAVFKIPRGYWLRLLEIADSPRQIKPNLWYSTGNGLFIPVQSPVGKAIPDQKTQWLLGPPTSGDLTYMLKNPSKHVKKWWLSKVRPIPATLKDNFNEHVSAQQKRAKWYFKNGQGKHLLLNQVLTNESFSIELQGPGEWKVEARLLLSSSQAWQRFMDIPLQLNGKDWQDWRLHPSIDHYSSITGGLCQLLTSTPEFLYLSLPSGKHILSFKAPQAMAVRVLKQDPVPFMFSHNQTTPSNTSKRFPHKNVPMAQASYNINLLKQFFSESNLSNQKNPTQSIRSLEPLQTLNPLLGNEDAIKNQTLKLIQQRYQTWRPLSITSSHLKQKKAWLVNSIPLNKYKSTSLYVNNPSQKDRTKSTFLQLNTHQQIHLQAPNTSDQHHLKISLPVQSTPLDLILEDRKGTISRWLWRPDLIDIDELTIASGQDVTALQASSKSNNTHNNKIAIASVSGTIKISHELFPISLSHNAQKAVWFSPFYQDQIRFTLDQKTWRKALNTLGKDNILSLLLQSNRPVKKGNQDDVLSGNSVIDHKTELNEKIWQDWQPLRNWIKSQQSAWSSGLIKQPFSTLPFRHEPLKTVIERLTSQSDYGLLIQLLKGMAIKDPDQKRRQQALNWLHDYYSRKQDNNNLSAYHSWQFQQNPSMYLETLADWLVSQGQQKLSVRLYQLANTSSQHLLYQHANLHQRWQRTHKSLSPLEKVWQATWHQDWQQAITSAKTLGEQNPWNIFMAKIPTNHNPVNWLQWVQKSPKHSVSGIQPSAKSSTKSSAQSIAKPVHQSDGINVPITLSPIYSAGTVQLHQVKRDVYFQQALALVDNPVQYAVIGPIKMQLSMRLQHPSKDPKKPLDDWLEITNNGDKKLFPIMNSLVSQGLSLLSHHEEAPGSPQQITLSLGPGLHVINIRPLTQTVQISAKVFSPPMLQNLVKAIQHDASFSLPAILKEPNKAQALTTGLLSAKSLLRNTNITVLNDCLRDPEGFKSTVKDQGSVSHARSQVPLATQWQAGHVLEAIPPATKLDSKTDLHTALPSPPKSMNAVEQHLLVGLWNWPNMQTKQKTLWLAQANAWASPYKEQTYIKALLTKLTQDYFWQAQETITASAGSRRSNSNYDSAWLAEREKLLFLGKQSTGQRLYGHNQLGFISHFKSRTRVEIQVYQAHFPYRISPPGKLIISLNKRPYKTLSLSPLEETIKLKIPAGEQNVRIRLENPSSNHWLYVKARAKINGQWRELLVPKKKRFHVATQQQPLELYLGQPSWIRIDELDKGNIKQRFKFHSKAGPFVVYPKSGQKQAMLRVMSLKEKRNSQKLWPFQFNTPTNIFKSEAVNTTSFSNLKSHLKHYNWLPHENLNGTSDNSNSVYWQFRTRNDFDSDTSNNSTEKFVESGWRRRQKLTCISCYWRSDIFARQHNNSELNILGGHLWLQGAWPQSSWNWQLKQSLFIQTNQSTPWKWHASGTLINSHKITDALKHDHKLQLFVRHLSINTPDFTTDNDIYSNYQTLHRWGIRLEEKLRSRPWLDTVWSSHFRVVSNELDQSLDPEYIQAGAVWHQYWKPLMFSLSYRYRVYMLDEDRDVYIHKPALAVNFTFWQGLAPSAMLQWKTRIAKDLDSNDYSLTLEASWGFFNGRGLRDYRSGESAFSSLRNDDVNTQLDFHQMNNDINTQ